MDVLFKRSAAGDSDPEFLFAVHKYHFQLHMRITECAGSEALRAAIEKNQLLVFNLALRCCCAPPRFTFAFSP
jgi:hypothetical protein